MDSIVTDIKNIILSYTFAEEAYMWWHHEFFCRCKQIVPEFNLYLDCIHHGLINVILWAEKTGHKMGAPIIFREAIMKSACRHFDVLKWVRSSLPLIPWISSSLETAVNTGNLEMVKWMTDPAKQNNCPCPWNSRVFGVAARHGYFDMLKWMLITARNEPRVKKDLPEICFEICYETIKGDNLEVLKWLKAEELCPWDSRVCCFAAQHGRLEILKWLRNPNIGHKTDPCPWDEYACHTAAVSGRLDILTWLRDSSCGPCPWNESTFYYAALIGDLQVLTWLRENSCPRDDKTCLTFTMPKKYERLIRDIRKRWRQPIMGEFGIRSKKWSIYNCRPFRGCAERGRVLEWFGKNGCQCDFHSGVGAESKHIPLHNIT